ncbi:tRNA/rRNA methyltransferase [Methanohalophilus levihalophilus]|uniref:RNA methyltransferase n=1 Tax=Methanohalophilus levihalophilus TaxID=1431282 RepID=UPI001AE1D14C|nr:RNA methyltransferase [Methanohalophilus levihalophilus]MBP2029146.1 tRNA/rRNA methyltransferase [Methanohalophilus levihalophilus]
MSPNLRIVLVEPLYQGNVGSVARSMKNFGYNDLVLVNPCPLEGEARAMASHAQDLLKSATIESSLKEAIGDANLVIGTSGISGIKDDEHLRVPVYTPKQMKEHLKDADGTVAVLFGREDNGLSKEELKQCDMILTIPTSEIYPVMNIAHATTVVLYEMSEIEDPSRPIADRFDLELLYEHLGEMLDDIGHPEHKKEKTYLMLRRIFGRAVLTPREVQTLRGIFRGIQKSNENDE